MIPYPKPGTISDLHTLNIPVLTVWNDRVSIYNSMQKGNFRRGLQTRNIIIINACYFQLSVQRYHIHVWDRWLINFKTSSPSVRETKALWTDQRWLTYTARFLASSSCMLSSGWRTVTELNWFLTSSVNHSEICDLW